MRLLWLSLLAAGTAVGVGRADPGKIIVDEKSTKNRPEDKTKWKPYDLRLFREERVHGEVLVMSPPLYVRGPPKGFPFRRKSKREAVNFYADPSRLYPTPDNRIHKDQEQDRVHGEILVHSTFLSVKGPPKGYPLKRRARAVQSSTEVTKSNHSTHQNSTKNKLRRQGVKPTKGRQSMMKRLKNMWPYFLVPTMMTLGYAPIVLSSLKMFVMNALMLNMMAFNAAIFLTLRNMVFGPRIGGHTKYYNFGYQHKYWEPTNHVHTSR